MNILVYLTYTPLLSMWAHHLFWVKKPKLANSVLPVKKNLVCVHVGLRCGGACVSAGVWRSDNSPPFHLDSCLLLRMSDWLDHQLARILLFCLPLAAGALRLQAFVTMSRLLWDPRLGPRVCRSSPWTHWAISLAQHCHLDPAELWGF